MNPTTQKNATMRDAPESGAARPASPAFAARAPLFPSTISTEPLTMLRWLIAFLLVANLAAVAAIFGAFGPPPAAGRHESQHLSRQIHPEKLAVRPIPASESADIPLIGGPVASPNVQSQQLDQGQ